MKDHQGPASHIHIGGVYAIRERPRGAWVLQVMPQVRIGPAGQPITLAHPVEYALERKAKKELTAVGYKQLVERVYSRIATEVYRRLERDVKEKLRLFPTRYLRAAALSHEAEDFARSNTVDAYERAIHPEALSAAEEGARRHPENPEIAQVLHSLRQQPAPPSQGQSRDSA